MKNVAFDIWSSLDLTFHPLKNVVFLLSRVRNRRTSDHRQDQLSTVPVKSIRWVTRSSITFEPLNRMRPNFASLFTFHTATFDHNQVVIALDHGGYRNPRKLLFFRRACRDLSSMVTLSKKMVAIKFRILAIFSRLGRVDSSFLQRVMNDPNSGIFALFVISEPWNLS